MERARDMDLRRQRVLRLVQQNRAAPQWHTKIAMPLAKPMIDISISKAGDWTRGTMEDLEAFKMAHDDEHATPNPAALRAGAERPAAPSAEAALVNTRRALIKAGFTAQEAFAIKRHSAKKIIYQWRNSHGGLLQIRIHRLLHHRESGIRQTAAAYDINQLVAPVQTLKELISQIRAGECNPDQAMAGRAPHLSLATM